jgi:uncharacterized hydrophobic protein (TIGR00271 family)
MSVSIEPPHPSWRVRLQYLWRRLVRPVSLERRAEVQVQLRESSNPNFDYFLLVVMSSIIATLGLLIDSPATIIGAMLVAPLMSPIIGLGLASIAGDSRLLTNAASGLARGAFLAITIAVLLTWFNGFLPFIPYTGLPGEVLARTHPSPIDLTIALAGGLAAAFALVQPNISAALPGVAIATALMPPLCTIGIGIARGEWAVAGGATLLFITNAVTIAFVASLVFFALGFVPRTRNRNSNLPRSLVVSAIFTAALIIPLSYVSYGFFRGAAENRQIDAVISQEVSKLNNVELVDWSSTSAAGTLSINITVRSFQPLLYEDSVALQEGIVQQLQQPAAVVVNQVFAARLDPLNPPTLTPTPTLTLTPTPGPSSTPTDTPMPTSTPTSTPTYTPSPTDTSTPTFTSTPTPTATPTPALALVTNSLLPEYCLRLRQIPGGPVIATLRQADRLTVLYGYRIVDGLVWIEVEDEEGRLGWVPQACTFQVTMTPTITASSTTTLLPTSSATASSP